MTEPLASPPRRRLAPWAIVAAVVVSGASALSFGLGEPAPAETGAHVLPITSPRRDTVVVEQGYVAEIVAIRRAEVRAPVGGLLEAPAVDEGATVAAGDVLFQINPRILEQELAVARAQLQQAEAELAAARLERDNSRVLVEREVVSPVDLALAEAKVEALQAARAERAATATLAEVARDLASVRAPFPGVVNRIPHKGGNRVEPGTLLTTLTDTSEVLAYFHLAEREALAWLGGDHRPREVRLQLADGSILPSPGVIDAIENEFDENGTLALRARFPNPEGRLRHGSTAKVLVQEELSDVVLVPQRSTFDVQGNLYVYVVDEAGTARTRRIVPQARHGDQFVVADGLADGDRFVLEGVQRVRDGDPVTPDAERDGAALGE